MVTFAQNHETMSENTSQKDEEIDLGQLFNLIGKGIGKVGGLFTNIFILVQNLFLQILFFFVNHSLKFAIAIISGAIIGFIFDYSKDTEYEGTMVVAPNFGSGQQLYENVAYYNSLTEQGDTMKLAEVFGISSTAAANLASFEIAPIVNENQILSTFDDYLTKLDSVTAQSFEFETYKENFFPYNYSRHTITVMSKRRDVFGLLGDSIIGGVINNPYYKKQQDAELAIIEQTASFYERTLQEVDTLREIYLKTMMLEASKENSQGTNINLAESTPVQTKELSLFSKEEAVNKGVASLERLKVRNSEIIDVISELPSVGFVKNKIWDRSTLRFAFMAFIGLFLFLVWMEMKTVFRNLEKK